MVTLQRSVCLKFLLLTALPCLLAAQTIVTLTSTPNPSRLGAPVVLAASVAPNAVFGSSSVPTGKVTFYDGVAILGTKPLVSGTASLSTILLPAGTRQLRALYSGDPTYARSASNVVTQRVNAVAGGSFVAQSLNAPLNAPQGGPPVVADFNGDGIADIAYSGTGASNPITVLLGKGDGTFRPPIQTPGAGGPMAVGDFNGDGIPDLYCQENATGAIFLGNGDGTFRQGATYTVPLPTGTISVADFNGDGNADILLGNMILLGQGDGTFTSIGPLPGPLVSPIYGTPSIQDEHVGDLNGDAKADRVALDVSCFSSGGPISGFNTRCIDYLDVYLGNGDGTFQSPLTVASASSSSTYNTVPPTTQSFTGSIISGFALGDFNNDGKTDILYLGYDAGGPGRMFVLPGNGDGTFGPAQSIAIAVGPVIAGDFNGDGITDLVVVNIVGTFSILIGNDDGTFQQAGLTYNGTALAAADFNGDGRTDLLVSTADGLAVSFGATNSGGGGSNLAQGKPAIQSSTYPVASAAASSAVDGNTDGAFFDSSVTATNADPNAWWQVDLGASATINSVVIWNRTDCCSARLSDYWVFISDIPFLPTDTLAGLQSRAATFASHQTTAPSPSTTLTANVQGRYVRVQLSDTDYLSLAEVQVFGTGAPAVSNLAQGKTATESSTYPIASAAASSAVDGNTDGKFFDGSVTATNLDTNAWWQVDLGATSSVSSVVVWNRTDCCSDRLSDYWVFVSNTPFLATDTPATLQNRAGTIVSHQTTAPNPSTTIPVNAQGRYVRVQLSGANYLSLAEVQVFGQ